MSDQPLEENFLQIVESNNSFTVRAQGKISGGWLTWDRDKLLWGFSIWKPYDFTTKFHVHPRFNSGYWLHWDRDHWDAQYWFLNKLESILFDNDWRLGAPNRIYSEIKLTLNPPPASRKFWTVTANLYREITIPYTIARYMMLPTWEHRRPKFLEILRFLIQPLVDMQNEAYLVATRKYNVDFSTGYELDVIGKWVGISRDIYPPIQDVYVMWDTPDLGWEQGRWHKYGTRVTGVTQLPDDIYRILIKAKIAANHWDGTTDSIYKIWNSIFGYEIFAGVVDHQDMSMDLILTLEADDAMLKTVIRNEKIPLRPAGVKVNYTFITEDPGGDTNAIFYWDRPETDVVSGVWDSAEWYRLKLN